MIFSDQSKYEYFRGAYVYLDNDFLSELFRSSNTLEEVLALFNGTFLTIDPFTEFEFIRDIYVPDQRDLRQEFISNFDSAIYHHEILKRIHGNALIVSKIYSHQKGGYNESGKGASFVDLFLAGRTMMSPNNSFLVTGNKKDYSPALFNTINTLTIEDEKGNAKTYYCLQFSKKSFEECFNELQTMENSVIAKQAIK